MVSGQSRKPLLQIKYFGKRITSFADRQKQVAGHLSGLCGFLKVVCLAEDKQVGGLKDNPVWGGCADRVTCRQAAEDDGTSN